MFSQNYKTTIIRTYWATKYESRSENEFCATCQSISNLFDGWRERRERRETWIVLADFLYCPSYFWSNKIWSVVGLACNVLNYQRGLDSSHISAGKRCILKLDVHKKKVHMIKTIILDPLHPHIITCIFHTVLHTFPKVLTRRICLTNKSFFSWWSFPLFSWP